MTRCGWRIAHSRVPQLRIARTLGGAYASFAEKRLGSIAVGKLADFVVLAADPTRVAPERIKDIVVEMTVIEGRTGFRRREK